MDERFKKLDTSLEGRIGLYAINTSNKQTIQYRALVRKLGGSEAVTAFARSIGDNTFRVDGWEPDLNSNPNNDIGIIWPPNYAPVVIAIYSRHNKKDTNRRDDILVSSTQLVINEFSKTDFCLKRNNLQFRD